MCGIAGAAGDVAVLDMGALAAMCEAMRLRGPDAAGTFRGEGLVLGHRRLSIIDLDGGQQPMTSADGALTVVFNGEIYNFRELRDRLAAQGHAFSTHSDTEVILHAYKEWGPGGVRELDGMFAFALWDAPRRRLLVARDRFGKKPLYYHHDGLRLIFASTLEALLRHPSVPRTLDEDALAEYLALEYVVAPRSIVAGVRKLEPASLFTFDARTGELESERYWRLPPFGTARLSEAEAEEELTHRLERAVSRRLISDVPLGVFLSGGVDSSLVAALAARERAGIETFTIGFSDPSFDETRYARTVAHHLGTTHHEEELPVELAADIVSQLGSILDEPMADGSIVPTHLLSRFARRRVTVALGGDGGDELFAGYPTYPAHRLAETAAPLLFPSLVGAARTLASHLPVSLDNFSLDFKVKKLLGGLDAPPDERNYVWLGAFGKPGLRALLGRDVDPYAAARARYAEATGDHTERVLYQDLGLYMCHSVLAKVDRASMAASLEVRAPLLDTAVAELAASLPLAMKLRGTTGKILLKRVARRFLPRQIVERKKKGFGMPIARWLKGRLAPLARDMLLGRSSLSASGLFSRAEVERLLDEHGSGRADHRQRLFTLLVLELWRAARL